MSREFTGHRDEIFLQREVIGLPGQGLGPEKREVKMAAAIVEGAELASGAFVLFEEFRRGGVEGVGEDLGLFVAGRFGQVLEGGSQGEEFAERIPAQVVFLGELLDVLRSRTAGPGFEESPAVHQRDDG